jgi:hypothetical protein
MFKRYAYTLVVPAVYENQYQILCTPYLVNQRYPVAHYGVPVFVMDGRTASRYRARTIDAHVGRGVISSKPSFFRYVL